MDAQILAKKIHRNLIDYGFLIALEKIIFNLIKPIYRNITYRIYRYDLDKYQDMPAKDSGFEFKPVDKKEISIIEQIEGMEEWLQGEVASMLENGRLCIAALDKERVAGFNLVSFDEGYIPLIGLKKKLREKEAWSVQITVNKDYRGKGLGEAIRYRIFKELKKRGIKKLYGGAQISNKASLKLAKKTGSKEITDVEYLKFFNTKRLNYKRIKNGIS